MKNTPSDARTPGHKAMKVTLLIPTFNEIGGMKKIMPRIKKKWVDEILIIDGGSTDGTIEYARKNGYTLLIQKEKGLGNAYRESIGKAIGDVIITFSPDGNSIPELIPPLIDEMKKGYDMVIVSRYAKGAKSYDDDAITAFGNWMFTTMINVLFRAGYTDTLVMFRAFKKEIVYGLNVNPKEPVFEPMICVKCAKKKLKVADMPGDEPSRIGGIRKNVPAINGLCILLMIIKEIFVK